MDNEYVDHGRLEAEWHKSSKVHCERRAAIQNGSLTLPAGVGDTWRFFGPPTVLEGVFSEAEAAGISDAVLSMHDLMTFDHRAFPLPEFRLGGTHTTARTARTRTHNTTDTHTMRLRPNRAHSRRHHLPTCRRRSRLLCLVRLH